MLSITHLFKDEEAQDRTSLKDSYHTTADPRADFGDCECTGLDEKSLHVTGLSRGMHVSDHKTPQSTVLYTGINDRVVCIQFVRI